MELKEKRRVTLSLPLDQYRELEILMEEDGQTNFTYYGIYLIQQEKKRRLEPVSTGKRPVGRPKLAVEEEDTNLYPAPYKGGGVYNKEDYEGYFTFRNQPIPPLPKPLTTKELEKYE